VPPRSITAHPLLHLHQLDVAVCHIQRVLPRRRATHPAFAETCKTLSLLGFPPTRRRRYPAHVLVAYAEFSRLPRAVKGLVSPGLRDRRALHRLHLRGSSDALHPARRMRGLRRVRAGLPRHRHLLRRGHADGVEAVRRDQRQYFSADVTGLGSPGGAARVGASAVDHPTVAAWAAE
jgi:hypothetical protein